MDITAQLVTRFNTDNPYTKFGQRILVWELVAQVPEGSLCAFLVYDIDRQIDYLIEWGSFDTSENYFKDYVWTCYQLPTKLVAYSEEAGEFRRFGRHVIYTMGGAHNYDFPSYRPHIVAFEYGEGRLRLSL